MQDQAPLNAGTTNVGTTKDSAGRSRRLLMPRIGQSTLSSALEPKNLLQLLERGSGIGEHEVDIDQFMKTLFADA
jgi:hypothetical protein